MMWGKNPNNIRQNCGFVFDGKGCMRPMNHEGVCHNPYGSADTSPPMWFCYDCESRDCLHVVAAQATA